MFAKQIFFKNFSSFSYGSKRKVILSYIWITKKNLLKFSFSQFYFNNVNNFSIY